MKNIVLTNSLRTISYYLLFFFLLFGCKKDTTDSKNNGEGSLVFNIEGIQPIEVDLGKLAGGASNRLELESPTITYHAVGNIDVRFQTEVNNMTTSFEDSRFNENRVDSKIWNKLAGPVDMTAGIKYVVILVNKSTNKTEFVGQSTVGQALAIRVLKDQEYDWYAYSYNTTANITLPTSIDDVIDTPTDKELLYAKGATSISTSIFNKPIAILFKHKLAEIVFEIDTDGLYGGYINTDVLMSITGASPLTKGKFSLLTGTTSDIVNYTRPISFEVDPNNPNKRIVRFYVVDITKSPSFSLNISNLKATFVNKAVNELIASNAVKKVDFSWLNNVSLGKRYLAKLKLRYFFPSRTVLHVVEYTSTNDGQGRAAQPFTTNGVALNAVNNKASHNLISESKNFGSLEQSIVRTDGFTHIRCYVDGTLNTFLANKPDITIIHSNYLMDADDRSSLISYINNGGVVILMTDNEVAGDRAAQLPFFRDFFSNQNITLQNTGYPAGAIYKLGNINDEILNGAFGDVRNKYWGAASGTPTSISGIPSSDIVEYCDQKAANGSPGSSGVKMFKHKVKNLFWVGDGGFLVNNTARGIVSSNSAYPFATVNTTVTLSTHPTPALNYNNYPIPKKYGIAGNGINAGTTDVYNSTIFANIFTWAIIQSEFFGPNKGGLRRLYPNVVDWVLKTDSTNINFN